MRVGVVDLDTSHPQNWIPLIRELGHEIAGVFDHGDVHRGGDVRQFVAQHDCGPLFDRLEQMVDEVDCAIIHACNWDTHVQRARPFVEAGRAVLLDKPVAGNLRDLRQIKAWIDGGARIAGGSSLRFAAEVQQWKARAESERGVPLTVWAACGTDEFNYGIHAYALLASILDEPPVSVRHVRGGPHHRVQIDWPDGRIGWVTVADRSTAWLPFSATIVTGRTIEAICVDTARIYRSLLEQVLPYLAGTSQDPPLSGADLIAPELWALAAKRSRELDGSEVDPGDLRVEDAGYDGAAFATFYRQQKYPQRVEAPGDG